MVRIHPPPPFFCPDPESSGIFVLFTLLLNRIRANLCFSSCCVKKHSGDGWITFRITFWITNRITSSSVHEAIYLPTLILQAVLEAGIESTVYIQEIIRRWWFFLNLRMLIPASRIKIPCISSSFIYITPVNWVYKIKNSLGGLRIIGVSVFKLQP